jgi:hypothetical protein
MCYCIIHFLRLYSCLDLTTDPLVFIKSTVVVISVVSSLPYLYVYVCGDPIEESVVNLQFYLKTLGIASVLHTGWWESR